VSGLGATHIFVPVAELAANGAITHSHVHADGCRDANDHGGPAGKDPSQRDGVAGIAASWAGDLRRWRFQAQAVESTTRTVRLGDMDAVQLRMAGE
jgi:hypothetical protein